jgi:hypothetical protein
MMVSVKRRVGLALAAAAAGMLAAAAPAAATPTGSMKTTFYCGSADTWSMCSLTSDQFPYHTTWFPVASSSAHIQVLNHAAGGEYCRIIVNGGRFDIRTIAPTYTLWTWLGNTGPNPSVQLECQRANPSGDAGIGGYIQFNY